MERRRIDINLSDFPEELHDILKKSTVYDSSCSKEARVYFLDVESGLYLKTSKKGSLKREAEMTDYFGKKGIGARVETYLSLDADWLMTTRVEGEDCTHKVYLEDPKRLSALLGERLRLLHEIDCSDCPVQDRMTEYFALAEKNYKEGNYDSSLFPDNWGYNSAESAWRAMQKGKDALRSDTLLHGDYCLPNIMLDEWRFSGFIDVGNGGVGDRHVDLFWGVWTLTFNLGTDAYKGRFLDAYGRELVDEDVLRTIAAAEVFG